MKTRASVPVAAASLGLLLLTACGGGGGSASSSGTATAPTTVGLSLSGYAAKGALSKALVAAYAVQADGTLSTTAAAKTTSGTDGSYTLPSFAPTTGTQYVVVVSSDGVNTTQADEATGTTQPLPATFAIRAFVPLTASATSTLQVTPFSELAVSAAAKRAFSPAAVTAATTSVIALIGFDPRFVQPKTVATSADAGNSSADKTKEIQLAALLTSVSTMASTNAAALGCTSGSAGDVTACVVAKFASSFSVSTTGTTATGTLDTALATAFATAVTTVAAANPVAVGGLVSQVATAIQPASQASAVASTASSPAAASAPSGSTVVVTAPATSAPATTPEDAVKALFTDLKTNLTTLFSSADATVQGAVNVQATQFRDSIVTVQVPADVLKRDVVTLSDGVQAYGAFKSGLIKPNPDGTVTPFADSSCTVYQDHDRTIASTSASNANYVGCATRFANVDTHSVHRFLLTPHADGVTFDYEAQAQTCTDYTDYRDASGCTTVGASGSPSIFKGTLSAVIATRSEGEFSTLNLSGDLPPAFNPQASMPQAPVLLNGNGKSSWSIALAGSAPLPSGSTASGDSTLVQHAYAFAGTFSTFTDAGTTLSSKITVKPGSKFTDIDGKDASTAIDLVVDTPQSEFEGILSAGNAAYDKSNTLYVPLNVSLTGALRNADSAGAYHDFFNGTLAAHVDAAAWSAYDRTQTASSSNAVNIGLSFTGTVTAPQRPALGLSLAASYDYGNGGITSYSGKYQTSDTNGKLLHTLALSGKPSSGITATEASSGISFSLTPGVTVTNVTQNGTPVATLDRSKHLITFPNGDFVSLEFGF